MASSAVLGKRSRNPETDTAENPAPLTAVAVEIVPSDTELVIKSIQQTAPRLHGFVFLHQVYSLLSNRTLVDEDICHLRLNTKSYKILHCDFCKSGGSAIKFANAMLLISTDEYVRSLEKFISSDNASDRVLIHNFAHWLRNNTQISVMRKDLTVTSYASAADDDVQVSASLTTKDVDRLINCGFLHYRNSGDIDMSATSASSSVDDSELFWLSHPAIRPLVLCMQSAEQEIVAVIYKTRYREISEKKLQRMCASSTASVPAPGASQGAPATSNSGSVKKGLLSGSPFPLSYHLLDLVGRNVVYKVAAPATSDFILRLTA